jgi:SulP family sulfate permease
MLHAVVLLVIVLGADDLASHIPTAVLAGILVKVGVDIIDWDYLKRLRTAPRPGVAIMLTVFGLTVLVDLMIEVAVGMVMASFLFMHRMTKLQLEGINFVSGDQPTNIKLDSREREILELAGNRLVLFHLHGPMSFSAAKGMIRRFSMISGYDAMILDLTDVPSIDFTSSRALDDIIRAAKKKSCCILLAGMNAKTKVTLWEQKVLDLVEERFIFDDRKQALEMAASEIAKLND